MNLSELSIATIRSLCIDMINKANSGHPGMAIGSAPALYSLFTKELKANPKDSSWFNRDRFVLASGHVSTLLYSLLHLSGYNLAIEDLKEFRQLHSKTPGHPEIEMTDGVDASSGPLGQGIPMAVGMAMAERFLAEKYNKDNFKVVDHYTYALCGDGDMQEGVTYEASSLAGHLALGKLIVLYDANKVTLDGPLDLSFSENVKKRYEAQGWQVINLEDGFDYLSIGKAIKKAKNNIYKPTLIIMNTTIGYGSKNQGTSAVHGNPLGAEDGKNTKLFYQFDHDDFHVPKEVYNHFNETIAKKGKNAQLAWNRLIKKYKIAYPNEAEEFLNVINDTLEIDFATAIPNYEIGFQDATRNTSEEIINAIAKVHPTFLSGCADLVASVKTLIKDSDNFLPESYNGRNLFFGIREFAMIAIANGMTLHKGVKVSSGGFAVFSDYFKAALRMACLMKLPIIIPLSHDSVAVGEDGPTHQPVEQLAMLRSMINIQVFRPCDANEAAASWQYAMETKDKPSIILLTRQPLTTFENTNYDNVSKGAYIISKEKANLDGILIATGSEVELAMKAQSALLKESIDVRVVSMPSMELFNQQSKEYQVEVLPSSCRTRLAIEMASSYGWHKYVGLDGAVMSVESFGLSAPANAVIEELGFNVETVISKMKDLIK